MHDLIVFSHLRWDFVYQRPQHVVSRLARRWRVLFVEEPVRHDGEPAVELIDVADNVTVLRFHTPVAAAGFHDDQLAVVKPMLANVLAARGITDYGVWFYTPMALPLLQGLKPASICYDCMDELSAFRNAPRQLLQRESALLRIANVVFTGGPSLYRAKQDANANVHCLPSSVDAVHFGRAMRASEALPELSGVPRPRLGFYGVIDERFDAELLARIAQLRPDWQFQIVGPIVKIDPAALPRRPNIQYHGQQPYANLPGVLAAWDIALLPFARNEATRFISPTKTLEYLAAGLPVVSTPINDVAELYGSAVSIAATADAFVAACDRLFNETPEQTAGRIAAARTLVEQTSWDEVARRMREEIEAALPAGLQPDVALLFADAPPAVAERVPARDNRHAVLAGKRAAEEVAAAPADASAVAKRA